MRSIRNCSKARLLVTAMLSLAVFDAQANQVAPRPIERGEWYLGAFAGVENFTSPGFKSLELYKDDSSFGGAGKVTITDPQGYLINHRVRANDIVPGFHFGYGIGSGPDDAVYRVEFSAEAFNRSESYYNATTRPPAAGFFVANNTPPPATVEVGLVARYAAIDGKNNADGSEAVYMFAGPIIDELFDYKEYSRSANASLYYDSRKGPWVYSRGVSITWAYLYQAIDHQYHDPTLLGTPGINQLSDTRFQFHYRSKSHNVGSRLHYSVGYEIARGWSVFTHGRIGFGAKYTNLKGRQAAPCLTNCVPTGGSQTFRPGTRKVDINDWKFAYDARIGFGSSARLGPLRLTVHGGGTRVGGWTTPREFDKGVRVAASSGWGYYATAGVDVAF